jgi:hypothetical protein
MDLRNHLKFAILTFVIAFGASIAAHAGQCGSERAACIPAPAPEVDASLAIAGISLLAGTLVVVRSRFRK